MSIYSYDSNSANTAILAVDQIFLFLLYTRARKQTHGESISIIACLGLFYFQNTFCVFHAWQTLVPVYSVYKIIELLNTEVELFTT